MTDWIEHTTDTCPVDPETVVEVRFRNGRTDTGRAAARHLFGAVFSSPAEWRITHYRIITPAKPAWLDDPDPGADPAKPPEPDMTRRYDDAEAYAESKVRPEVNADAAAALKRQLADAYRAGEAATPITSHQPMDGHNLITLRLECLKLAGKAVHVSDPDDWTEFAEALLHYVLNGSVDKA
jgi:hypothetical protein